MPNVYSMTGFARATRLHGDVHLSVTLKSVNHRFLDLRWQLPSDLDPLAAQLEARVRARLHRGHVDIRVVLDRAPDAAPALNDTVVATYLAAHAELSRRLERSEPPAVNDILRFPGIFSAGAAATEVPPEVVAQAFDEALSALDQMRRQEGVALTEDLLRRCDNIQRASAAIAQHRDALGAAFLARLRHRVEELLGAPSPSPDRLLQETALLAERADISEELTRLDTHRAQFEALLKAGGEVGKKLDFLTQELNREVNTLLSKTTSALDPALRMAEIGLDLKAEIEKIREQVQNLE